MAPAFMKRQYERFAFSRPLNFSLNVLEHKTLKRVSSKGMGINISEEGMCFATEFPLEPGHILKIEREGNSFYTAMVKWVGEQQGMFRVGVFLYK